MGTLDESRNRPRPAPDSTDQDARMRVSEAEREAASTALAEHYAAGRLAMDEYYERLDAAWSARVRADLDLLFTDLPRAAELVATAQPVRAGRPHPRLLRVVALLVLVGVLMLLGVAWWVPFAIAGGMLLHANARHRHHHRHHHHPGHHGRCR